MARSSRSSQANRNPAFRHQNDRGLHLMARSPSPGHASTNLDVPHSKARSSSPSRANRKLDVHYRNDRACHFMIRPSHGNRNLDVHHQNNRCRRLMARSTSTCRENRNPDVRHQNDRGHHLMARSPSPRYGSRNLEVLFHSDRGRHLLRRPHHLLLDDGIFVASDSDSVYSKTEGTGSTRGSARRSSSGSRGNTGMR